MNGSTRFLWGLLLDKFSFKTLVMSILILQIVIAATFYYSTFNPIVFLIENFGVALSLSGIFTMITPQFTHDFGKKNGTAIYSITGFLIGISSFLGPILTHIFIEDIEDYEKIYLTGGGVIVVNVIVWFTYKSEPFVYNKELKEDERISLKIDEGKLVRDTYTPDNNNYNNTKDEPKNSEDNMVNNYNNIEDNNAYVGNDIIQNPMNSSIEDKPN